MIVAVRSQLLQIFSRLPERAQIAVMHMVSPKYGLGSLVVVRDDLGRVMLLRHSYKPNWGLPGGIAKRGEDPVTTAHRETFEETGLRIELVGTPHYEVNTRLRKIDVLFHARIASGLSTTDAQPKGPEIVEIRWFGPDELPSLQSESILGLDCFPSSEWRPDPLS